MRALVPPFLAPLLERLPPWGQALVLAAIAALATAAFVAGLINPLLEFWRTWRSLRLTRETVLRHAAEGRITRADAQWILRQMGEAGAPPAGAARPTAQALVRLGRSRDPAARESLRLLALGEYERARAMIETLVSRTNDGAAATWRSLAVAASRVLAATAPRAPRA